MTERRKIPDYRQVTSGLRQQGCPLCTKVLDPDQAVEHHGLQVHEACKNSLSWGTLGKGRSPYENDPSDVGAGSASYEE